MRKLIVGVALGVALVGVNAPSALAAKILVTPGGGPHVRMFGGGGNILHEFFAYGPQFDGGVNVAIADVVGDPAPEIITGAGPSGSPAVRVFAQDGTLLVDFPAFDAGFKGGVFVAAGDVDNNGKAEIIAAPGYGSVPVVRVFEGTGGLKREFLAYDQGFNGGVHVSAGEADNSGFDRIVTAPSFGGGPHVRVFDGNGNIQKEWFAYDGGFKGGVNVAAGLGRVATAPASEGGPQVKVFNSNGAQLSEWFAYPSSFQGGVTVAMGDVNGSPSVVTGAGPGGGPHVKVFSDNGSEHGGFFSYVDSYGGGVNVAVGDNSIVTGAGVPRLIEVLQNGTVGGGVAGLQERLLQLGYWLPGVNGKFDANTTQAVLAFQKAMGLPRDGKINPEDTAALASAQRPTAQTTSGSLIEVDKARQILFVIRDGVVQWAFNTSTGSGKYYTYEGKKYLASTPEGVFTFERQINGVRVSHLGELYRPKYFVGGYAIHGSPSIPAYPASHGCVRLSNAAIDFIWGAGLAPLGSRILLHS